MVLLRRRDSPSLSVALQVAQITGQQDQLVQVILIWTLPHSQANLFKFWIISNFPHLLYLQVVQETLREALERESTEKLDKLEEAVADIVIEE